MKLINVLLALVAGPAALAMMVPPPALDDPAVRRKLDMEQCVVTYQTCLTRVVDGHHMTSNCDIRILDCEEDKSALQRQGVKVAERQLAETIALVNAGGARKPQRRVVLEA